MRNYVRLYGCEVVVNNPTGPPFSVWVGPYLTQEEFLADSIWTADILNVLYPTDMGGPGFYLKLSREKLCILLRQCPQVMNFTYFVATQDELPIRESWSHGE